MAEERTPRTHDNRETDQRASDTWVPPALLPVPNPIPGWTFHWVRTSTLGVADNSNVSKRLREGFVACKAEDHPEMQVMSDVGTRFKGNIEVNGMLLCKAPDKLIESRTKHHSDKAARQMESVDESFMREQDSRMPLFKDRKTRQQFGKG